MRESPIKEMGDPAKDLYCFFARFSSGAHYFYGSLLLFVLLLFAALPFCYVNISLKVMGMVRPMDTRVDMRSVVSGTIQQVYVKEGAYVQKGDTLLWLHHAAALVDEQWKQAELKTMNDQLYDLQLLRSLQTTSNVYAADLKTPLYVYQYQKYQQRLTALLQAEHFAALEMQRQQPLVAQKIVAEVEFQVLVQQHQKAADAIALLMKEQLVAWQSDFVTLTQNNHRLKKELMQAAIDKSQYVLIAPISGTVQGSYLHFKGTVLQAGELFCTISPEGSLMAECFVGTKDLAGLHPGQLVRYHFEAYDSRLYGVLNGRIRSIDKDFTTINNQPMFRVCADFTDTVLSSKSGHHPGIVKGLSFRAHIVLARRSLWHLLYEKADDWMHLSQPSKSTAA